MKLSSFTRASGFTLAETTISAGIISTALIAVLGLLSTGLDATQQSRIETSASILVRRLAAEAAHVPVPTNGSPACEVTIFDAALQPLASESDASGLDAMFIATTQITESPAGTSGPRQVVVTIQAPASVAPDKRSTYRYVTLAHVAP